MATTTESYALTKCDLKALRQADRICFDHGAPNPGEGVVRAVKCGKAPFRQEATHSIPVRSSVFLHGADANAAYVHRGDASDFCRCFVMVFSPCYDQEWQTVVSLLRAGDELSLRWIGADNNGYVGRARVTERDESCHDAGLGERLYHDRLYLKVRRAGKEKYSFYLADSACPNNSARMIRA